MPDAVVASDTWNAAVGDEPESTVHHRVVGLRTDSGTFLEAATTLAVQPGRVDWNFGPPPTPEPQFSTFGEFPQAAEQYLNAMSNWAQSERFPETRRLALGVHLVEASETREAGYERLRDFIDAVPRGEASDFLYQVNRYRPSRAGVAELRINRLAKWSVAAVQTFSISDGPPVYQPPRSYVSLDLDVNTTAEFAGPIPRAAVPAVFDDLRAGVREIANDGDRVR